MLDTSSREAKEMLVAGILTSGDAPPSGFELHAVARGNAPDEAKLVVIGRARDNPRRGLLISLSEKGIVGFSTGCGNPPEDLAAGFTSFEIAPPASR
jgi:hypothetical protein